MAKNKQKKIRVAKNPSLPEVLLADDGKNRIREISDEDVMAHQEKSGEPIKKSSPGKDEFKKEEIKKQPEIVKADDHKIEVEADHNTISYDAPREDNSAQHEAIPAQHEAKPAQHEAKPAQHEAIPAQHEAKPAHQEAKPAHEKRHGLRIAALAATFFCTLILAVVVGGALALWDLGKTPSDLVAAMFGSGNAGNTGLTFADVSDTGKETKSTGLTFIDADDTSSDESEVQDDSDADSNIAEENAADVTPSGDSGNSDDSDDGKVKAGDIVDGNMVVSAELSGISSIVRAGQEQTMSVTSLETANATNPDDVYPLPFTVVDESYFEDALFVGDSRFYGFCMWSGIPGANYCATSFNIFNYETFKVVQTGNGKVPIFSALPYNAFSKIYIKVGLNEMGMSEAAFEAKYAELIGRLREMEPRAIIYIHAVLPVTAAKSASDKTHNNPNIIARNASLQEFAKQQKAYYIDASPVVTDENGCLKAEMTGDGIHMASRYMGVWKQFLMEHAVVVPQ